MTTSRDFKNEFSRQTLFSISVDTSNKWSFKLENSWIKTTPTSNRTEFKLTSPGWCTPFLPLLPLYPSMSSLPVYDFRGSVSLLSHLPRQAAQRTRLFWPVKSHSFLGSHHQPYRALFDLGLGLPELCVASYVLCGFWSNIVGMRSIIASILVHVLMQAQLSMERV